MLLCPFRQSDDDNQTAFMEKNHSIEVTLKGRDISGRLYRRQIIPATANPMKSHLAKLRKFKRL